MNRGNSLKPGDKLGSYELLVPVGAGGMGRVWAARERSTTLKPRVVAIKTALAEDGATESFWKVLLDEARIASQVQHPNVCGIHEVERERGIVYLVMDWSDGGSLRELLDASPGHRLEPPIAARILARVCSGLHAVHELIGEDGEPLGVVHRDVSPQNVLISAAGQVRITDFGVAKARGQLHAPTQTGEVKGKIAYMAPEQVTTRDIDRRADIFALGCVLYEATVGSRPFQGGDALATLYQLLEQPVPPPSERLAGYPPGLEAVVMKALERDPAARYATSEELGRALETWLVSEKISVSDANVKSVVSTALGERIAARAFEIQQAVHNIEHPPPKGSLKPVPAPVAAPVPPSPPALAEQTEKEQAATLGGSSRPLNARDALRARSRMRLLIGGGVALAAVALIVGSQLGGGRPVASPQPTQSSNPVVAPPPTAAPSAEIIEVTLRAEPANAALFVDDGPALPNPHRALVPRDTKLHRVRAVAEGFVERVQEVSFDRSKDVVVVLHERIGPQGKKPVRRPPPVRSATTATAAPKPSNLPPSIRKPVRPLDSDNPFAPKP